jgi:thymidylate synthase
MKKFMDTLGSSPPYLHGAYGPRVKQAIPNAIAKLQRDSDSRQAVVTIYDAKIDLISTFNDIPCTIALHFLLRHDQLDLHTYMRSNDINWGIAYDVFQFTQLQHTMARCMNVEAGRYTHHATSLHVYEKDLHAAREVRYPTKLMPAITGIGVHTRNDWHHFRLIAEGILTGKLQGFVFTPSEQWMLERMKPYAERMG